MSMPPEHEFTRYTRDEWEEVVYRNAVYFTVYVHRGRAKGCLKSQSMYKEFEDFKSAVCFAEKHDRSLIYAVCKSGRFDTVPRHKWSEYLKELKGE